MTFTPTHLVLLVMAVMAYVLVTAVMTLLSSRIKNELEKHILVRKSREIRRQYVQELAARQEVVSGNVEIDDGDAGGSGGVDVEDASSEDHLAQAA